MIKRFLPMTLLLLVLAIFITGTPANLTGNSNNEDQNKDGQMEILLDQRIPLNDGITLSAIVYKPSYMPQSLPAVFAFTPYIADEGQKWGPFFASHGYVYVQADVRGRGNSQGEFLPIEHDAVDGAQVVAWIAQQPWCNGEVVMRGGSYRGGTQWQILKSLPKALKTIVPTASICMGVDVPKRKNIYSSYNAQWLAFTQAKTPNITLFSDFDYWQTKFYHQYSNYLPFKQLAQLAGTNQKVFLRWLDHPAYDAYWQSIAVPESTYKEITIPILTITGFFDDDQTGAMEYYHRHMQWGSSEAKSQHYLLIGPWSHSGTRYPTRECGGLIFGENAVLDMPRLHQEWYDWVLKGKEKPEFLEKRVCYYMMGDNRWEYADSLETISNHRMSFYLSSANGEAGDVFHSGTLQPEKPRTTEKPDVFIYDPLTLISKEEYCKRANEEDYLLDPGAAYAQDKLVYHSAPFSEAVRVVGYVRLKLYLSLNVKDTDLQMTLHEIQSDGKTIFLAADQIRARYRNSPNKEELVVPGTINSYTFDKPFFFARKLERGSRLRLLISPINSPDYQKNYNAGGIVANETDKDAQKAVITLYHTPQYPSVLELPVKK